MESQVESVRKETAGDPGPETRCPDGSLCRSVLWISLTWGHGFCMLSYPTQLPVKLRRLSARRWSWSSNTLATWYEELTPWKRPWCWKRLKAGEGDNRGWDGWMAPLTRWTWVWAASRSWWWQGTWCAAVHGVTKSQTRLSDWSELNWMQDMMGSCGRVLRKPPKDIPNKPLSMTGTPPPLPLSSLWHQLEGVAPPGWLELPDNPIRLSGR